MACNAKKPFTLGSLSFEQLISFFNCKLRMLAAKLRGLLNPTSWQQLQNLDCVQRDCFEKMLRCLCPNFSCDGNKPFPANDSQEFPAFPTGGAALPFLDDLQLYFQLPFCVFLCLLGQNFRKSLIQHSMPQDSQQSVEPCLKKAKSKDSS